MTENETVESLAHAAAASCAGDPLESLVHLTRARQTILSSCPPQWFSTSSATSTSAILASILQGRQEDQHCYGDDSCHPTSPSPSPSPSSNNTTAQFPSADRHQVDAAAQTLAALISQADICGNTTLATDACLSLWSAALSPLLASPSPPSPTSISSSMSASTALASLCRSLQVGDLPLHGGTHLGITNGAHNLCKAVESMKQDQVDQGVLGLLLSLLQRALKLCPCDIAPLGGHPPLAPLLPFITRVMASSKTTASLTRKVLGVISCHPSLSNSPPSRPSSQPPSHEAALQTPRDSLLRPLVACLASILHPAKKAPPGEGDAAWGMARQEAHNRRRSLILLLKVAKLGGRETAHEALMSVRDGTRGEGGICYVASGDDDDLIAALDAALLLYAHLSQESNKSSSSKRLRGQAAAAEGLTCVCSKGGQGGSSAEDERGRFQCGPAGDICWAHDMLNPVALLDGLCASLHGDHAVMLDLLVSNDTRALAFLLSCLRRLEDHQQSNKRQRTGDDDVVRLREKRINGDTQEFLQKLGDALERSRSRGGGVLCYDPAPILRRLWRLVPRNSE